MTGRIGAAGLTGLALSILALAGLWWTPAAAQEDRADERRERDERTARVIVRTAGSGGYLGVRLREVDAEAVSRLGLPEERGALVQEVLDGTPAEQAGLRADDVIVRWNEARVESTAQLSRLARETPPGRRVRLGVLRDGREREVAVELGEPAARARALRLRGAPEGRFRFRREPEQRMRVEELRQRFREMDPALRGVFAFGRGRLGASVQGLTGQLAGYFGVPEGEGALITSVREGSPAEKAGLKAGDVVLSVAGEKVRRAGDISRILRGRDEGPVEVRIMRDRSERSVTVQLEKPEAGAFFGPGGAIDLAPLSDLLVETLAPLDFSPLEIAPVEVEVSPIHLPSLELAPLEFAPLEVTPLWDLEIEGLPERAPLIWI